MFRQEGRKKIPSGMLHNSVKLSNHERASQLQYEQHDGWVIVELAVGVGVSVGMTVMVPEWVEVVVGVGEGVAVGMTVRVSVMVEVKVMEAVAVKDTRGPQHTHARARADAHT